MKKTFDTRDSERETFTNPQYFLLKFFKWTNQRKIISVKSKSCSKLSPYSLFICIYSLEPCLAQVYLGASRALL